MTKKLTEAEKIRAYRDEVEANKHDPYPGDAPSPTRPGQSRAKVFSVRLNPEELDELNRFAEAVDVPASALVRGWILQRLRKQTENPFDSILDSVVLLRAIVGQLPPDQRERFFRWSDSVSTTPDEVEAEGGRARSKTPQQPDRNTKTASRR